MTAYGITDTVSVSNQPFVRAASTAVRTFVTGSTTAILLLPDNPDRVGVIIYNDSNAPLYVGLGSQVVTSGSFTTIIGAKSERGWEYRFTGEIRGVWDSETAGAFVTELT